MAIFLNFVVKTVFVFSAYQKPFALVLQVLHLCYRRAALLSQPIRIE